VITSWPGRKCKKICQGKSSTRHLYFAISLLQWVVNTETLINCNRICLKLKNCANATTTSTAKSNNKSKQHKDQKKRKENSERIGTIAFIVNSFTGIRFSQAEAFHSLSLSFSLTLSHSLPLSLCPSPSLALSLTLSLSFSHKRNCSSSIVLNQRALPI